jgi:hypothetical protein
VPKVTEAIGKLIGDKAFQDNVLGKAGSIGALISVGISIYQQIKYDLQKQDERAFGSLIKIAFESAQESLPERDKIPIKDAKSENIKRELFDAFINTEGWNSYLPDHPVIVKFRSLVCSILKYEQHSELVRDFVFNFNITLEEKADHDLDIQLFKRWSNKEDSLKSLIKHLEYSRSLIYKTNPAYQRSLNEYYIENNAILAEDIKTWEKEDKYFLTDTTYHQSKEEIASNFIHSFLNEKNGIQ